MRNFDSFVNGMGAVAAALVLSATFAPACAPAASAPLAANAPARGITVSGVGKASGKPNIARSTVGVEARAGSAEAAIGEVNTRMAQVIAAIKQAGVADGDVRTATISLNFERNYEQPPQPAFAPAATAPMAPTAVAGPPGKPVAPKAEPAPAPVIKLPQGFYTASNTVELTIRNLDAAGKVLTAATAAGANQVYGLRFELEELAPLQTEARKKAVEDAKARAERLAQLAGVKLGAPVSIVELDGGGSGPVPMMAMAKMDSSVPVERGELTITSTVQIVYALPE